MNSRKLYEALGEVDEKYLDLVDAPDKEIATMKNKHFSVKITRLLLAACLIFALTVTAYATDIGRIQRIIQIWQYGNQTTAVLDIQNGEYTLTDGNGSLIGGGGGVAIAPDGTERPLTEAEILDHLNSPDLVYQTDGTVWLFFHEQKIQITGEMFNADGYCFLELRDGTDTYYLTIDKNGGMSISSTAYVQPIKFRSNGK